MSLQVWLPLNGDLRNQGCSNVTITNNGATVNTNGKIGSCYHFGTASQYMNISKEAMNTFTTECSVAFWLKIKSWNTSYATYFQAGLGGTAWAHYIFGFLRNNANSTVCFTISNGSSASNASYLTSSLSLDTWYHVVLTYTTGKCTIYLNGALDHEYTTSIVPNFAGITTITLGKCNNGSSYQTDCDINDFRIYDHALSAAEVKEISQGLVLHYKLDDLENGVLDSSGYNYNGIINGTLTLSNDTPRYSMNTQFPGTAYIKITSPSTEIKTVSLWAKWNSIQSGQSIIYVDQKSKTGLGLASNGIIVNTNQTGNTFNKSNLTANTWYHFVIVSPNGSSNASRKFYINGVEQTALSSTNSWSYTIDELQLGKRSTSSDGFNGKISDFRMYCTALSAADIIELYHTGAKIDNKGGTHAYEFIEHQDNILFPVELSRTKLEFTNGLSRYTQSNCQVNLVEDGYHIYRPPNLTQSANGNTMWGGLQLVNQSVNTVAAYDTTRDNWWHLQQNHTYIAAFHARGKSSNATTWSWTNNMGWGGGGVQPSPTTIVNEGIPADFNGEKDCFYIFKITDAISKPCTTAYSAYAAGTTYLSYRHLTFGWGYTSTGTLGTDLYLTNFRLYDITSNMAQFTKQGQANFYDIIEQISKAQIRKNSELLSSEFIEL